MITCLPELPPESSAGTSAEVPLNPSGKVMKGKVMNDEVAKIIELLKA